MKSTMQNIVKLAREVKALCDFNTCYFQEIYDYVERVRDEVEAVHVTYNPDKRSLKFFCNNDCEVEDGDVWVAFFTVLGPDLEVSAVLAGDLIEVSRELASAVESL